MELAVRAAEIIAEAKRLRSDPKDVYHDSHKGAPQYCECPAKMSGSHLPQCQREPAIDEQVVAFAGRFETAFSGPCAERVLTAVKAHADAHADRLARSYIDGEERRQIETAKEYANANLVSGQLVIRNSQWNDVLAVLHAQGIGVTATA